MPTVVITGANRGLGFEFARQYAGEGWAVHATSRDLDKAADLRALDGDIAIHRLDVRDAGSIAAFAKALGGIAVDLLINNAGIFGPRGVSFGKVDDALWTDVFLTNAVAPLHVTEALMDNLRQAEQPIVATLSSKMGSIAANSTGGEYIYRSSKAAVNAVIRSMAMDLARTGVTCVALHPEWVQTDMGGPSARLTPPESVAGMRTVIAMIGPKDTGRFFNYDGDPLPW